MKDYQNDFRHLRCFLFLVTMTGFSLPVLLLKAEEDACNEEGGESDEGGWRDGKGIFTLSEECSQGGEDCFNNF